MEIWKQLSKNVWHAAIDPKGRTQMPSLLRFGGYFRAFPFPAHPYAPRSLLTPSRISPLILPRSSSSPKTWTRNLAIADRTRSGWEKHRNGITSVACTPSRISPLPFYPVPPLPPKGPIFGDIFRAFPFPAPPYPPCSLPTLFPAFPLSHFTSPLSIPKEVNNSYRREKALSIIKYLNAIPSANISTACIRTPV